MTDASGAGVAAALYREAVAPLLARHLPALRHAAGRLGSGSAVFGYDDATSRAHDWGCRLTLLVDDADGGVVSMVDGLLDRELPERFRGFPVRFATTWDARVRHRVEVGTVTGFARSRLGVDPSRMSTLDWLVLTGQSVLEVVAGPVFADGGAGGGTAGTPPVVRPGRILEP